MEKLKKVGKGLWKGLWKVGILAGSGVAIASNPLTGACAGIVAIASVISSSFKDKSFSPVLTFAMKLINLFAVNMDKAENDKKVNEIKKK